MGEGLIWLAGFIVGGLTTFLVTAVTVWKPLLDEKRDELKAERKRGIEAEGRSHLHGFGTPVIKSEALDRGQAIKTERAVFMNPDDYGELIDLTGVDDVPE